MALHLGDFRPVGVWAWGVGVLKHAHPTALLPYGVGPINLQPLLSGVPGQGGTDQGEDMATVSWADGLPEVQT